MNRPSRVALLILVAVSGTSATASAQTRESSSRAAVIVASFNKSKHSVKERRGVRVEKFKDVRAEPVVPSRPSAFSGTYEAQDFAASLQIQIDDAGNVTGTGTEPYGNNDSMVRKFTVRAHLDGALVTGTKVYGDGTSEKIEGVFINRTSFESPSDKGTTAFGLGVLSSPRELHGLTVEKVFYQRVRLDNWSR